MLIYMKSIQYKMSTARRININGVTYVNTDMLVIVNYNLSEIFNNFDVTFQRKGMKFQQQAAHNLRGLLFFNEVTVYL
jgi:hypothetical protein